MVIEEEEYGGAFSMFAIVIYSTGGNVKGLSKVIVDYNRRNIAAYILSFLSIIYRQNVLSASL